MRWHTLAEGPVDDLGLSVYRADGALTWTATTPGGVPADLLTGDAASAANGDAVDADWDTDRGGQVGPRDDPHPQIGGPAHSAGSLVTDLVRRMVLAAPRRPRRIARCLRPAPDDPPGAGEPAASPSGAAMTPRPRRSCSATPRRLSRAPSPSWTTATGHPPELRAAVRARVRRRRARRPRTDPGRRSRSRHHAVRMPSSPSWRAWSAGGSPCRSIPPGRPPAARNCARPWAPRRCSTLRRWLAVIAASAGPPPPPPRTVPVVGSRGSDAGPATGTLGVRHPHVGVDGSTQGGRRDARRPRPLPRPPPHTDLCVTAR